LFVHLFLEVAGVPAREEEVLWLDSLLESSGLDSGGTWAKACSKGYRIQRE
jgi:hypothetical protein